MPTEVVGGNDWNKVAQKFIKGLIFAFIAVALPYSIEFLQNEDLSTFPTWFLALIPVIVGILSAIQNAWAHREKVITT